MSTLPDHPADDTGATESRRWTRGRVIAATVAATALIVIIVVHAAGLVGG